LLKHLLIGGSIGVVGIEGRLIAGLNVSILESNVGSVQVNVGNIGDGDTSLSQELVEDGLGGFQSDIDLQVEEDHIKVSDVGLHNFGVADLTLGKVEIELVVGGVDVHVTRHGQVSADLDSELEVALGGAVSIQFADNGEVEGQTGGEDRGVGVIVRVDGAGDLAGLISTEG